MLTIFKYKTWIVLCLMLILSAASWYFFGRATLEKPPHKRVMQCSLNTWSVFLGTSVPNRPLLTPLRIFFLTLALYGLNMNTIFTSKLINVFTHPSYENQIDTIEEIIESNLPIGKIFSFFSGLKSF